MKTLSELFTACGGSAVHPTQRDTDGGARIVEESQRHGPLPKGTPRERIAAGFGTAEDFEILAEQQNAHRAWLNSPKGKQWQRNN